MAVGANLNVTVANVAVPDRPHQAGLRLRFLSLHPDVDHNPKPVRNGERRPPFSGRSKYREECLNWLAGAAFSRMERLMRRVRIGQTAPRTRDGSAICRPRTAKASGSQQEV
jgi:hypothetical protein